MSDTQSLTAVLMPGIDGTGTMFGPLIETFPAWLQPQVISYPTQAVLSYQELTERVVASLPSDHPYIIIAESFSGPLALMVSERAERNLKAIILCATFLTNPRPWIARLAPLLLNERVFGLSPRAWMLRILITGNDAPGEMLVRVIRIHKTVSTRVLIHRLREVIQVDVRDKLKNCSVPIMYLYGKRDHLVLQYSKNEIQDVRPDMSCIEIDGPHFLLQVRPQPCMDQVLTFLQSEHLHWAEHGQKNDGN